MKKIIFSPHGEERRKQRGISKQEVEYVLEFPKYVKKTLDNRRIAVGEVKKRFITVIYRELESYILVITVY